VAGNHNIPWDIYVDERKVKGSSALGFLAIPNTASFAHKLFYGRRQPVDGAGRTIETREIHWSNLHRGVMRVCENWIDTVFQHRHAKFYVLPWPRTESKEFVTLQLLKKFCMRRRLEPPFNVVVIFDYDSSHAKARIQNTIRTAGQIARCYHLDSSKNDCIQCCDLLLGTTWMLKSDPTLAMQFPELKQRREDGDKLKNSEVRRYLSGLLGEKIAVNNRTVYDFTRI